MNATKLFCDSCAVGFRACRDALPIQHTELARVWKMIASTQGLDGSAPLKQYFLVAIDDRDEAIEALNVRNRLFDAVITVAGEASPDFVDWLHVQAGDIVCVLAVS